MEQNRGHKVTITTWVNGSMTNTRPQSGQTGVNGYLSPPRRGTPVVVLTKHNCI